MVPDRGNSTVVEPEPSVRLKMLKEVEMVAIVSDPGPDMVTMVVKASVVVLVEEVVDIDFVAAVHMMEVAVLMVKVVEVLMVNMVEEVVDMDFVAAVPTHMLENMMMTASPVPVEVLATAVLMHAA